MNRSLFNAVIAGAITGGVLYAVFKLVGTSPDKLAAKIQSKVRKYI